MRSPVVQMALLPLWAGRMLAGEKSFEANPLLRSPWLNRRGLHRARVVLAHRVAQRRRRRSAPLLDAADLAHFERHGFVLKRDFLPADDFARLLDEARRYRGGAMETLQGDTLTRKIALDGATAAALPEAYRLIGSPLWLNLLRHVGALDAPPVHYLESILTGIAEGAPDPQTSLHADTFHPTAKGWLYLTSTEVEAPPFVYVPGSHRLTPARLDWETEQSLTAPDADNPHTRQGSFRIGGDALAQLGLPPPVELRVPANTLLMADTFGFHARGPSTGHSLRVEIWAYGRRSPFLPALRRPALLKAAAGQKRGTYESRAGSGPFDVPEGFD